MRSVRVISTSLVLFVGAAHCQWAFPTNWGGWPDWWPPATLSTVASPSPSPLLTSSSSSADPSTTSLSSTSSALSVPTTSSTLDPPSVPTTSTSSSPPPAQPTTSTPPPSTTSTPTQTTVVPSGSSSAITLQPSASSISITKGQVNVHNQCPFPVFVAQVLGGKIGQAQAFAPQEIGIGNTLSYPIYEIDGDAGVSLKMSLVDDIPEGGPWGGLPIAQFEYTAGAGEFWYDMSMVDCVIPGTSNPINCPFLAEGWNLVVNDGSCPSKFCAAGNSDCLDVYYLAAYAQQSIGDCNYLEPDLPAPVDLYLCVP